MSNRGFTLVELLLIIVLISILAIAALVALDPFEQIKKGRDTSMFNASNEVYGAIIRFYAIGGQTPYTIDMEGVSLESNEGQKLVNELISTGELKNNFSNLAGNSMSEMFFTGKVDLSYFTVCFIPKSKSYKENTQAIYNKYGSPTNCNENDCYMCSGLKPSLSEFAAINEKINSCKQEDTECEINNSNKSCCSGLICVVNNNQSGTGKCKMILLPTAEPTAQILSPTPTVIAISPTPSYCEGFDPEKPQFPFTCNYSSKWSKYGCTNYCVQDLGCDSYCPSGQRHLRKNYYTIPGPGFWTCLSHINETVDNYCVSGTVANCANIAYPSSDLNFLWGCTNPRRPYAWK